MSDDQNTYSLETARETIQDTAAQPSSVRRAAWHLFDAARFDLARRGFERLVEAGELDADVVTALQQIYGDGREFGNVALLIDRYLDAHGPDLSPNRRFDALVAANSAPNRTVSALQLLEAAAAAGPRGWAAVIDPARRAGVESVLRDPSSALSALEQFLYASAETGLPPQAIPQIEQIGRRHAANRELARAAERLLHAAGHPDAAYRVEACRRAMARPITPSANETAESGAANRVATVTIAGGHSALRSMARRDLATIGVAELREIPPAWEATRLGRAIQATLAGSDLVVVIGPQIAHATSDQVREIAARLGVPVVTVRSAGLAAIRHAVERFAGRRGRD